MAPTAAALLLLALIPSLFTAAAAAAGAFNITLILQQFPDLSGFNDLLSRTKIADEINRRTSITILAVDGSGAGAISGLAPDVMKRVAAVHVLLDYYDAEKLNSLKAKSMSVTTLYQTSGNADQRQGYVNMSTVARGIRFGSSMPGAPQDSELMKVVYSKPYNLSVFQISKAIMPPGIEKSSGEVKTSPPTPQPAKAPAPASKAKPPAANAPQAKAPTAAEAPEAVTPTAADAPAADVPSADAPTADSPAADAPAADSPAADGPAGDSTDADADAGKSSAARMSVGAVVGAVMLAAFMLSM